MNGDDEKRKFFVKEEFVEWVAEAFAEAQKKYIEKIEWVEARELSLSTARNEKAVDGIPPMGYESGNYIKVVSLDGEATLMLDTLGTQEFNLTQVTEFKQLFHQVYITNTAQSGKNLVLVLGRGDFSFPESPEKKERRAVLVSIDQFLGMSATWTSDAFDVLNYGRVTLLGQSEAPSYPDGVRIQQSIDGTNWDYSTDYTAVADTPVPATIELVARFVRVSWRHATAHQGRIRLALLARSMP